MLSLLHLVVKAQQYFVTSNCMSLDEKIVFEIWLNLGLNLTIFRGTGPRAISLTYERRFAVFPVQQISVLGHISRRIHKTLKILEKRTKIDHKSS